MSEEVADGQALVVRCTSPHVVANASWSYSTLLGTLADPQVHVRVPRVLRNSWESLLGLKALTGCPGA